MEPDQVTAAIEADALKVAEIKTAAENLRRHLLEATEPDPKLIMTPPGARSRGAASGRHFRDQ